MNAALKRFGRVLLASVIATAAAELPSLITPLPLPDPIKLALIPLLTATISALAKRARLHAQIDRRPTHILARAL